MYYNIIINGVQNSGLILPITFFWTEGHCSSYISYIKNMLSAMEAESDGFPPEKMFPASYITEVRPPFS